MIYEESEIITLLQCEHCSQQYQEYHPPRILPCCAKTICYSCVQTIQENTESKKYKCIVCNREYTMPDDGFIVNQLAAKLLAKQPKEISRGPEAEKLKQNISDLEVIVKKFMFEIENGEYLITEDCRELRRQVQLAKEEKIEEINKHYDTLILKIDNYEEKCKSKYKEMNYSKQKGKELIKLVNESIQQQNAYLRKLKIDEKETTECNQKMSVLKTQIEEERKFIKKSIFGNKILKFEANSTSIDEEFLGKLILPTLDFTKILSASLCSIKLLDMNTSECLKTFEGHSDLIRNVQLLNENQIVSCSKDKTIKIWNMETGDCIKTLLGHSDIVCNIAILSNNRIISCSWDESIRIWDEESGDCIKILNGHTSNVYHIVKKSNECVLSGSSDKTIKLWNVNSGECLRTFTGHLRSVLCVEVISNERIMSGSKDKSIKIWNVQTGDCLQTLEGHTNYVRCIKVLCDERIISGSDDGKIRIWCLEKNSCIQTINAHSKLIREIQVLSDNQIASSSNDNTIKIWDLASSNCIKTYQSESTVSSIYVL